MVQCQEKALVVLSGGQDSTICLFIAKRRHSEVHTITFDYGQRHRRELTAAQFIAGKAGVASHEVIPVGPILAGRSPLTNPDEKLETYIDFNDMDKTIGNRVELTFVPMRNPVFLTLAVNRATCKDIFNIYTGVCQADNANYPDCRQVFVDQFVDMTNTALGRENSPLKVQVHTPLMDLSKDRSIRLALSMDGCYTALGYSHTAYDDAYPPLGRDHASVLRAHGFEAAGVPDPLIVRAWLEDLMLDLPPTTNYSRFSSFIRHLERDEDWSPDWPASVYVALQRLEERVRAQGAAV